MHRFNPSPFFFLSNPTHPVNRAVKYIQSYIDNQQKSNSISSFKGKASSTTINELVKPYLNPKAQSILLKFIYNDMVEYSDEEEDAWSVDDFSISELSFGRIIAGSPALYGPDDTFLHILCACDPTPVCMDTLFDYYFTLEQEHQKQCSNSEVENWSIISHKNKAGATPLHVAVARSAHPQIIEYLLSYRARFDFWQKHQKDPYNYSTRIRDEETKDDKFIPLSSISMNCRSLPLHLLFSKNTQAPSLLDSHDMETAILLLLDYPDALWSSNINDETPLHLMWENYFSHISSWPNLLSRQYRTFTGGNHFVSANLQAARAQIWDKIVCLLGIVLENGQRKIEIPSKDTSESLSSTSNIKTRTRNYICVFVDAALSKIDNEKHQELLEYLHQFDINGKLILHCASEIEHWKYRTHLFDVNNTGPNFAAARLVTTKASDYETNSTQSSSSYNNDNKNVSVTGSQLPSQDDEGFYYFRKDCIIDHLLHLAPDTASIPTKNNTKIVGQLPLHLALTSSKEWEEGVGALVRFHPDGVREKDPLTGLYPFMLAAVSNDSCIEMKHSKNANHVGIISNMPQSQHAREDCEWVFTIYSLLRECPEVLNSHYLQLYAGTKRKYCEINDIEYYE